MSVGGGSKKKNVSVNLIKAIDYSKKKGATVLGIVGRDGGYTKKFGDLVVVVPTVDKKLVTPYSESFHSVVWHCLVSHPLLQIKKMKW
jgi:D-sedoheptulose 7-phosphate isomerase